MNQWWGHPSNVPRTNIAADLPFRCQMSDGRPTGVHVHANIAQRVVVDATAAWAIERPNIQRMEGYVFRKIRNGNRLSTHSWGTAFDAFLTPADVAPPGGVWTPHAQLPESWFAELTARGWTCGRYWKKRPDTPHHQFDHEPSHALHSEPADLGAIYRFLTEAANMLATHPLGHPDLGPPDPAVRRQLVRVWQEKLITAGYDPGPADGDYGSRTAWATYAFQDDEKFPLSAMVGPGDWNRLVLGK